MSKAILDLLKSRRSIRKYGAAPVDAAAIDAILEAGVYAPSGAGKQSAVVVSVERPELVKKLSAMNAAVLGKDTDPFYGAPVILLVFADGGWPTHVQDGSCALENMMVAAHALGLGTCWINREKEMFETPEGRALMKEWGLPEKLVGVGALALGHIEGEAPAPAARLENRIVKIK